MHMIAVKAWLVNGYFIFVSCFNEQSSHTFPVYFIVKNRVAVLRLEFAVLPAFTDCGAVSNWVFFSHFSTPLRKFFILCLAQLPLCKTYIEQSSLREPAFYFFIFRIEKVYGRMKFIHWSKTRWNYWIKPAFSHNKVEMSLKIHVFAKGMQDYDNP